MAIELPSRPDILDERLASLEDPFLAERLMRENPALFAQEPPRTQREILAWTTRRWGTTLLAVTAAVSIAAGYFGSSLTRGHAPAPAPAQHAAAVALPLRHAPPAIRHRVATPPEHVAHRAVIVPSAQPAQHHNIVTPVAVIHTVPRPAAHPAPVREVLPARTPQRVHERARSQPQALPQAAAAPQSAAAQLAAWEATHRAQPRANAAAEPAPRTQPRSEPASATETTNATASRTEPVTTTSAPGGAPDPGQGGGVKTPPTNPGGVWTERIPGGGTLGGAIGPIIGVPRDSCTPRGGRTGIVMEAISVLMSSRH
jgi:hypothetical protein